MAKNVLVFGSDGGLGKAVCKQFWMKGYEVFGENREALDFKNPDDVEKLFYDFKFGTVVNCVGVCENNLLGTTESQTVKEMFNVNVITPFLLTQHILNFMEPNGAILHVSSILGNYPQRQYSLYSATKAALNAATYAWGRDFTGIRFYSICPGLINTPMGSEKGMRPERVAKFIYSIAESDTPSGTVCEILGRNELYGLAKLWW